MILKRETIRKDGLFFILDFFMIHNFDGPY